MQTEQSGYSEAELIRNFLYRPEVDFYSGKAKVKVKSSRGTDKFVMYVRSRQDSVLWFSGKRLSVEGGRLQVDTSTATIINRLDKTYQVLTLESLQSLVGFSGELPYLQDMVLGLTPELDTQQLWKTTISDDQFIVKTLTQNLVHEFQMDKNTGQVTGGYISSKFKNIGSWTYGDYRPVSDELELPFFRSYEVQMDEENYLSFEFDFSELEINETKRIRFDIPSHYTRIE